MPFTSEADQAGFAPRRTAYRAPTPAVIGRHAQAGCWPAMRSSASVDQPVLELLVQLYLDHSEAARLTAYCASRGTSLRASRRELGKACDQLDRADLMLAETASGPGKASPSRTSLARDRRTPDHRPGRPRPWSRQPALPLDLRPPPIPPSSPSPRTPTNEKPTSARSGAQARACPKAPTASNRQAIAARGDHDRLAVEQAYQAAINSDAVFSAPEPTKACRFLEHAADREIELE